MLCHKGRHGEEPTMSGSAKVQMVLSACLKPAGVGMGQAQPWEEKARQTKKKGRHQRQEGVNREKQVGRR